MNSAALNVAPVTSNSFVLHFPLNHDHVNMTFGVEVDGQQWALTRRNFYIVSGLTIDRAHTFIVNVFQNRELVTRLQQTVYTEQFSEQC